MNEFRNNNNLSTLWDVLIEENIISIQNQKELKNIQQIFEICINKFCKENEELFKKSSLLNINKLFIKYFKVEQQFQIKQQEFQSFHTINIPTEPELQNTILDKPISNMNLLVEEMIKKRNLDYIPAPIVPIVPENNIKKLKIEDILEDYDNKSIKVYNHTALSSNTSGLFLNYKNYKSTKNYLSSYKFFKPLPEDLITRYKQKEKEDRLTAFEKMLNQQKLPMRRMRPMGPIGPLPDKISVSSMFAETPEEKKSPEDIDRAFIEGDQTFYGSEPDKSNIGTQLKNKYGAYFGGRLEDVVRLPLSSRENSHH
jgi:hypothetical protein